MNNIAENLKNLYQKIENTTKYYKRNKKEISLLIVTKNQKINTIENIIQLKQKNFGENYVQEGIKKIKYFQKKTKNKELTWHYIGTIQSNKTHYIAKYFDWCQTLQNEKNAYYLNKKRPKTLPPLNVLIQININSEKNKSGIHPNELIHLSNIIKVYSQLQLRGIMCIPKHEKNFNKQLETFNKMQELFKMIKTIEQNIDTLSLGMSNDMTAAIASGSTLIRIGKAIFNKHNTNLSN